MSKVESRKVAADEAELRLDRWFKRHFPDLAHGRLEKLLRTGQVRVEGKRAKSNQRLEAGQEIRIPPLGEAPARPEKPKPAKVSDDDARMLRDAVLYKDQDVIALNKPPGLAVQGGTGMDRHLDGMLDALKFEAKERPRLVHRLDKDTSGVLLLARSAAAAAKLAAAFKSRDAEKLYWALVAGVPKPREGRIDAAIAKLPGRAGEKMALDEEEGDHAITYYRVVDHAIKVAWLALFPKTGRTHQLRVHCAAIGTPILGDGKYGGQAAFLAGSGVSRKLHLHARAIEMPHPAGGILKVEAPLPEHIAASFKFFGFEGG